MDEPLTGIITATIDGGAVVDVGITGADGVRRWYAADGDLWRKARAAIGKTTVCGLHIEYQITDQGGLLWFSVIPDESYVRCPNCRGWIPPHLSPDSCHGGLHRRKMPPPANGVHHDEA